MAYEDFGVNFGAGCAVNIVTAVGRQARYCYQFNRLEKDLHDEHEKLTLTRDGMERQLGKDKANSKESVGDLQLQLNAANELIGKVEKLKGKAKAKKSCCLGVCPNWICQCIVGKEAEEKTEAMKQLNEQLKQKMLSAHRLSLRCLPPSEDFILFNCTAKARDEILEALKDDKNIRIGLNGMAGCGKTSLLREVHKEVEDHKLYKTAFVVVSDPPKYLDIQDSIASWIGLEFNQTEKDQHVKAARLRMTFQNDKKYLIILDNVWQTLEFQDIGIPVGANCKVILSTRQRHIFQSMNFNAVIDLSLPTKEEARELFKKHADDIKDVDISLIQEIADECHRLPVVIKAVARVLRGKELSDWTAALATLKDRREPLNIEKGMEDPYRCLKYSFDELKDPEEVSLYLLCALFPNNSDIAIEVLIRFAFGLGIFRDINSYQGARPKMDAAIKKFRNYCMLLQEGQYVKLHDMFHALALWQANKKTQVIMGPSQINALTEANHMKGTDRLYCDGIKEFPDRLNCPELEILIVSNNGGYSSKFPDAFFKEMMKLKVLAIKNTSIGTKPILLLPQSIERLKKLRTLCLRGWELIDFSIFEKLEMLDTIELLDCVMEELPKELAKLKALKLLEISNCKIRGNPYKVLATCLLLLELEELYFVENHLPQMLQIGQNVAEFFHQICLLQRYHLVIGGPIDTSKDHSSSKLISINNFDASITNEAFFQALSQTLEALFLEKLQGDCKSIIPDMFPIQGECLNELEEFVLRDSDCIKCLIDTTNALPDQTKTIFATLRKLKVDAMTHLEALCHGPPPSGLFEKLRELFITNCSQMASLFTTTTAQNMVMLEVLEVIDCGNLRHMIKVENNDEDISEGPVLPNLKQVSVKRCENLKCMLPVSFAIGLSQLESLEIEDAAKLQYVFDDYNRKNDKNQKQISIDLSAVKIFKLVNLRSIISVCPKNYDMKLPLALDKLLVAGCPRLRGIDLDSEARQQDGDEAMEQANLLSISNGEDSRFNTWVRIVKDLARAPARKARYIYQFDTFVTDLRKEKDLLSSKLNEFSRSSKLGSKWVSAEPLDELKEQMRVIWLKMEVAMLLLEAKTSKSCCYGVFPNWFRRYAVGKRIERMTNTVKQFDTRLKPKHGSFLLNPNNVSMYDSRKGTYDDILEALKDDEICMIGLCGIGGCGKTSLIVEVCNEVIGLKLFDMMAFVMVSDPPDIRRIQDVIAHYLGFTFNSDENETERAATLSTKLNNGDKFLVVLDDIWQVLKLEDVGIPLGEHCKVVLTTRLQHICTLMDCHKTVYLSFLTEQEAWILFQEHSGVTEEDGLKDLAQSISRKCQGLPVAIIAVARALKDKPKDVWEEALSTMTDPETTDISTTKENVFKILELNVNRLGDDGAKSLFLLCALFPEDSNVAQEILIRFAVGLGIVKDVDSYETARIEVGEIFDKLIKSCLLLLVDEKRQYFRMEDLMRKVALQLGKKIQVIMGPEDNLIALTERDYMKDTTRLYCHDINEYPILNCPKLEFLFVSNDGGCLSGFSDGFFVEMIELRVLTIIDTSIWTAPNLLLPQSMDVLKKLRTICLRGYTLNNISILGNLEMLDTIELLYCVIKELPEELAELRRLCLLEVSGCKIQSNPFEVLTRCSQLEELYFVENSLPEMVSSNDHHVVKLLHQIGSSKVLRRCHLEIGSSIDTLENDLITKFISMNGFNIPASNEEMKNVAQKLEVLFLENVQGDCKNIFPDMISMNETCMTKLTQLLLQDSDNIECLIDTTNLPRYQVQAHFPRLRKLKIKTMRCFKALFLGPPHLDLFETLKELFIVGCSQLHCIASVGTLNFYNLKRLQLEGCPKLTSIFTYSTAHTMILLEILKVRDCISLKHINDEEEEGIISMRPIFQNLKQVSVKGCPLLESIIPASFLGDGLSRLESLEIEEAGLLKHVFGKYANATGSNRRIDLPVLKILILVDLPNITSICPRNYHIRWPDVAKRYIRRCPKFSITSQWRSFRDQELELPAKQSSEMVDQSVEDFHLEECKMEGIFQLTRPAVNMESKSLSLSCLQSLVMENLPNLRYISEGHKQLLNLRRVKIYNCGKLKCIFSLRMMTYISALRELIIEDCSQLEQIIVHKDHDGQHSGTGPFSDNCHLQRITVKSCPMLESLFTVSTAKTLRLIRTLKIEECPGMKFLVKDESAEERSAKVHLSESIFPNLSFLSLKDLPNLIHVCEGGKLKAVKGVMFPESFNLSNLQRLTVKSCPILGSLFTVSTAKTLMWLNSLEIIECSGLEYVIKDKSKEIAQDYAKEMLPKLNILHLVKLPNLIIIHPGIKLQYERCEVHDCPNLKQTLSATMVSGSSEVVAIHQVKEVRSPTGLTCSTEDRDEEKQRGNNDIPSGSTATSSNFHLLKQDGTVLPGDLLYEGQVSAGFHLQSQEPEIVDTQEGLQKQKFCPDDSMNLRESNMEIVKASLHKDPVAEESTVGTSSQVLIGKQAQVVADPQHALQDHNVSLSLPVDPTVLSSTTTITVTPLREESLASSSSTNQHPPAQELVDFHGLFKIEQIRAHLLEEAFVKYPHLWEWQRSQRTLRIRKVGYESLADMLAFLESETPKTMNNAKMEEFKNLYYELQLFGFDKMWLASIHQRLMNMKAEHDNKLKQLDQLESQISTLKQQLSDATASLASLIDDLLEPSYVFGF